MLPSEQGPISDITQPFHAFPACPYTDLCVLNWALPFDPLQVVPPIALAAPGASTNRTSSNRSGSSEGSLGRFASWPFPNHACSAAAPGAPAGMVHLIECALPGSTQSVLPPPPPPLEG